MTIPGTCPKQDYGQRRVPALFCAFAFASAEPKEEPGSAKEKSAKKAGKMLPYGSTTDYRLGLR
jgi:hypothetical protein